MIQAIIYGVMALGAIAAVGGFLHHERSLGADAKAAEVAPVIALCGDLKPKECATMFATWKADRDKAVAVNEKLQSTMDELRGQLDAQNAEGQRFVDESGVRKRRSMEALEAAIGQGRILAADEAASRARAAQATVKGQSCEKTISELGDSFRELAARELRDRPPAGGGGSAAGAATRPQNRDNPVPR